VCVSSEDAQCCCCCGVCRMRIRDLQILNGLKSDSIFEGDVLTVATGTGEKQHTAFRRAH